MIMHAEAPRVSNPEGLNEMAMAYFKDRLLAISADIYAFESAYHEGKLTQNEFVGIRRSLMQAKGDVQAALDKLARVESLGATTSTLRRSTSST